MDEFRTDYQNARLLGTVLTLYYTENKSQSQIAEQLELSIAKVNRVLQTARRQGLVEIKIHTPFQRVLEMERELKELSGVRDAVVVPHLSNLPDATLQDVGQAAAIYLLENLKENDTITLGGGRALSATIDSLIPHKKYNIRVVPAIGGVQGQHFTDVNNLAAEAARCLGGVSFQLHAPAYMDTDMEREILYRSRQVSEVLDLARQASIAMVGIGTLIMPGLSSYLHFNNVTADELYEINQVHHGVGEIFSQAFDFDGKECAPQYSRRVIGLSLQELKSIPLVIGVAAAPHKSIPVAAALKGHYLKAIILDEETASDVIGILKGSQEKVN
ncbi:MAG: sugar-binding transcriptional regulator [Anaerolineaceae bacterium]|nr:sugar-binding transcriptional regulator [Anaerolineaceae bacterium]